MMGIARVFGGVARHGDAGYDYHVQTITATMDNLSAIIEWADPCDSDWIGTKIVRKTEGFPTSVTDGTLVVDSRIRNQYAEIGYIDSELSYDTVYYYKAFPYSNAGINSSYRNQAITEKPPGVLSYSGAHKIERVEHEGKTWEQWTFTGSGVLTLESGEIPSCRVWMCSGGSCGGCGSSYKNLRGGLGGFAAGADEITISGSMPVTVGAGSRVLNSPSGASSFAGVQANGVTRTNNVETGGSGGGAPPAGSPDKGDGKSKYPFSDRTFFAGRPHCAGGGGGGFYLKSEDVVSASQYAGGVGGTDGADGGSSVSGISAGGLGGLLGGGKGGNAAGSGNTSTAAIFYGGGGGGTAIWETRDRNGNGTGGNSVSTANPGYQGVVYLRIPVMKK